jgi:hypothetical protein
MERRAISRDILRIQGMQSGQMNIILLLDPGLHLIKGSAAKPSKDRERGNGSGPVSLRVPYLYS